MHYFARQYVGILNVFTVFYTKIKRCNRSFFARHTRSNSCIATLVMTFKEWPTSNFFHDNIVKDFLGGIYWAIFIRVHVYQFVMILIMEIGYMMASFCIDKGALWSLQIVCLTLNWWYQPTCTWNANVNICWGWNEYMFVQTNNIYQGYIP